MPKELSMYNYDDNGALSITHFAPDTVTTACGAYILDGRAAWTQEPGLVEGCPPCLQAAQNARPECGPGRQRPPCLPLPPAPSAAALATTWAMPEPSEKWPTVSLPPAPTTKHRPQTNCPSPGTKPSSSSKTCQHQRIAKFLPRAENTAGGR